MKAPIIILLLLATTICLGQERVFKVKTRKTGKSDLQLEQFKGKVKSITVYWWTAVEDSSEAIEGPLYLKKVTEYNKDGNRIAENITDYSPELPGGNGKRWSTFKYNKDGNQIEEDLYQDYGQGTVWSSKIMKKYDVHGNKTEESYCGNDTMCNRSVFKYDSLGNAIEQKDFGRYDWNQKRFISKYNQDGNEVEKIAYTNKGQLESVDSMRYNVEGFKVEEIMQEPGYSKTLWAVSMLLKDTYYQYDAVGNWTKMAVYEFGKPMFVKGQSIEYY